jgi:hypothetical protein
MLAEARLPSHGRATTVGLMRAALILCALAVVAGAAAARADDQQRVPYYPLDVVNIVAEGLIDDDPSPGAFPVANCRYEGPAANPDSDRYTCPVRFLHHTYVFDLRWDRVGHVWPFRRLSKRHPPKLYDYGPSGIYRPGPIDPDPDAAAIAQICPERQGHTIAEDSYARLLRITQPTAGPYYPVGSLVICVPQSPAQPQAFLMACDCRSFRLKRLNGRYFAFAGRDAHLHYVSVQVVDLVAPERGGSGDYMANDVRSLVLNSRGDMAWVDREKSHRTRIHLLLWNDAERACTHGPGLRPGSLRISATGVVSWREAAGHRRCSRPPYLY